jgi:hypothetical protein
MRTNARSLSALLLTASAVALSGCDKPKTAPKPLRPPKLTSAFVANDGSLTHFPSLPDKKLAQLSEKNQDTIMWCSPYGKVHIIKWSPKSPFDKDPVYEDGCLKAGPPSTGTNGQRFIYDAELWLSSDPDGQKPIKIDPIIEVME